MRPALLALTTLLLAIPVLADEPTSIGSLDSPEALAAFEARFTALQARVSRDLEAHVDRIAQAALAGANPPEFGCVFAERNVLSCRLVAARQSR